MYVILESTTWLLLARNWAHKHKPHRYCGNSSRVNKRIFTPFSLSHFVLGKEKWMDSAYCGIISYNLLLKSKESHFTYHYYAIISHFSSTLVTISTTFKCARWKWFSSSKKSWYFFRYRIFEESVTLSAKLLYHLKPIFESVHTL